MVPLSHAMSCWTRLFTSPDADGQTISVKDGRLSVKLIERNVTSGPRYNSGRLTSKHSFTYGLFIVKATKLDIGTRALRCRTIGRLTQSLPFSQLGVECGRRFGWSLRSHPNSDHGPGTACHTALGAAGFGPHQQHYACVRVDALVRKEQPCCQVGTALPTPADCLGQRLHLIYASPAKSSLPLKALTCLA